MIYTEANQEEYETVNNDELWTLINARSSKEYLTVITVKKNTDVCKAMLDFFLVPFMHPGVPAGEFLNHTTIDTYKKPKGGLVILSPFLTSAAIKTIEALPEGSPIFAFIGEDNNFTKKHLEYLESKAIVFKAASIQEAVHRGFLDFENKYFTRAY